MSEPAKVGLGRLLILSTEFPPGPGGIGTHAYQLALHLSRRGWVIQVVTPQAYVSENKRDRFNGEQPFSIVSLSERAGGLSAWRQRLGVIAGTIRDFRPDVVIASGRRALWAIAAVRMRFAVPWVAIVHGSELDAQSASTQFLTTQALARAFGRCCGQ
ncbi:MAG: glycosyltransferase [Chloroflexota bacterium]